MSPDTTTVMEAASAALGEPLSGPVLLSDTRDSRVLRCHRGRDTVIVKSYTDARDSFTAEAAGLALAVGGPELLAADVDHPLIVMTDLGEWPSLADVLLGDDPQAARDGLLSWARGLGEMARRAFGRQDELHELRRKYSTGAESAAVVSSSLRGMDKVPTVLEKAGITIPAGLADDIAELGKLADDGYPAFTPGDTCPDNNVLTPAGLRFLDYEAAGFPSVFLTAAYCRMPFSSCWCVFRLDPALAALVEETFRAAVVPVFPDLCDDDVWHTGMRRGIAAWSTRTMLLTKDALARDPAMGRPGVPSPTVRQLLVYRCEMLHRELTAAGDLPALAETAGTLLRMAAREWDTPPLSQYPAFAI
jgi:hypothetical protein